VQEETVLDAAARKALLDQRTVVTMFPQVKRRHRNSVLFEAGRNLVGGYNFVRYLLGTYRDSISYSNDENEEDNAESLIALKVRYPVVDDLLGGLDASAAEFITELATYNADNSILQRLFGTRQARAIALACTVDGMHIALAEADTFL
jgi:hypothetical protein